MFTAVVDELAVIDDNAVHCGAVAPAVNTNPPVPNDKYAVVPAEL